MSGKSATDTPKKEARSVTGFGAIIFGSFTLAIIAAVAFFNLRNRERLAPVLRAEVDFVAAPERVDPGGAARFVVRVAQGDGEKPLANRVLDVTVTPAGKAEIIAVGGGASQARSATGARAKGRTDGSGTMGITVRATEPGRYTLVALDSASGKGGVVNFHAVAPGG